MPSLSCYADELADAVWIANVYLSIKAPLWGGEADGITAV